MRHLFDDWSVVTTRLSSAPVIALFLDFDGTLARLRPRPEQVSLDRSVRQALAVLARSARFRVCVISGRRRADVQSRIRIPRICYLGLHGSEGKAGAALSDGTLRCLSSISSQIESTMAEVKGIWIEDKEFALSVHYRSAAEPDARRARSVLEGIVARCPERFRIEHGKNVWEVLPREFADKGAAVKRQLASLPGRAIAVYVGDDAGDESAFAAARSGITVRVGGHHRSQARYRLSGVAQVGLLLKRLSAEFK